MTSSQMIVTATAKHPLKQRAITFRLVLSIIGAVMGSAQYGFNLGVINSPELLVKRFMNESHYRRHKTHLSENTITNLWALAISIYSIGGCFGGLFARQLATQVGRKRGCLINIIIGVVASALMVLSKRMDSFEAIVVARFLLGGHCGLYISLVLMYLSEISTPQTRGSIGTIHQLACVIGMLVAQVLGFPVLLGTEDMWDILLGLSIAPCLLQAVILPFCPESPRFLLINRKDVAKCREALTILRGTDEVDMEIAEIQTEMSLSTKQVSLLELLRSRTLRRPLVIAVVLQLSLQLSGISGIFFNSTALFRAVVSTQSIATYTTSAVGAIMILMALVTIPLMDRAGRRTLQLVGLGGIFVCGILITVTFAFKDKVGWFNIASIVLVLLFVIFFTIGPGCVSWIMSSELFSHDARPTGMAICVLTNNLATFLVGYIFPILRHSITDYVFLPFTVLTFIFFMFTFFFVPETKGKTFEEVSALWQPKKKAGKDKVMAVDDIQDEGVKANGKHGLDNPDFVESSWL